jgi:predicted TIM-barrel fold metal-dependent hydrolase
VVGRLDPAADDFEKHLRRFARDPRYRGLRISHQDVKQGLAADLARRCQWLVDLNLELDVNGGPDIPAEVARWAEAVPKLRIVINHCGNLKIAGREPPRAWQEGMQAAAKHPRVFCKVSALVEQTGQKEPPRELDFYRPVLDALWSYFGEDRLIYGSNWPVSARFAKYEDVLAIVREYFTAKGEAAARKYFSENAHQAYLWEKTK